LGYRRCFSSSVRALPRSTQGVCWYRYKFHGYIEIRRRRRFWRAVCHQVDISFDPPDHIVDRQPHRCCGWHFRCHQQRLSILGSPLRKAVLCLLGDCPLVSFLEGFDGPPEQDTNNHHCVVHSISFHLLPPMGENRSLLGQVYRSQLSAVRSYLLIFWSPKNPQCTYAFVTHVKLNSQHRTRILKSA
jgi:hypothetical protein